MVINIISNSLIIHVQNSQEIIIKTVYRCISTRLYKTLNHDRFKISWTFNLNWEDVSHTSKKCFKFLGVWKSDKALLVFAKLLTTIKPETFRRLLRRWIDDWNV